MAQVLAAPRGPDNDGCLGDAVADRGALSPNEAVADRGALSPNEHAVRKERAGRVRGLLDQSSSRERQMLRMRFGLDGANEGTLDPIGQR